MAKDSCFREDCKWLNQDGNCSRGKNSAARREDLQSDSCPACFEAK